jgi:hypothetical protein
MNESNKSGDSSLHDWFTKSRASDGTPGWVQLGGKYAGKPCAKQPGQTTKPKCGSSKMKRNLDKGEEETAFRRKNREDPNPNKKGKAKNVATEEMNLDEKCWQGYTQKGMKKKGNKTVPNCVPVNEIHASAHTPHEVPSKNLKRLVSKAVKRVDTDADGDVDNNDKAKGELGEFIPGVGNKRLYSGTMTKTAQSTRIKSVKEALEEQNRVQTTGQAGDPSTVTYKSGLKQTIVPGSTVIRDVDTKTKQDPQKKFKDTLKSVGSALSSNPLGTTLKTASESFAIDPAAHRKQQRIEKATKLKQGASGPESQAAGAAVKRLGGSGISLPLANSYQPEGENIEEVAAWQRKAGKNKEGGLNEKGRKSYERENPGSDLKAPSKKVGNPRRKSFCARMSGMKKKLTSSKTANDPNSRINKSLRAWNC